MARMELNIRKLAQLAGTSYSTVSRALNDSPLVKDSTKQRIRRLARDLGYQIDFSARSLATGMRMIVGVVYPYHSLRPHESMYTSQAIDRIRIALSQQGFDTLTAGYADDAGPGEDIARLIRQKKVDGLLVFGHEISDRQIAQLHELDASFLLINPPPRPVADACSHISIDHEHGGYLAGKRLIAAGRGRLLCVREDTMQFEARTAGFARAAEEAGRSIETLILTDGRFETAYRTVLEQMTRVRRFDGIFVESDTSSIGVLNALLDNGVAVPGDVSIVGYDDIQWSRYSRPALTTVHQPVEEVAELAAEGIVALMAAEERDERLQRRLQPVLVDRESC